MSGNTVTAADLDKKLTALLEQRKSGQQSPYGGTNLLKDSQPYSILKAAALSLGYITADECKSEVDFSNRLRGFYENRGFIGVGGAKSILVPMGARYIPQLKDPDGRKLAVELTQMEKSWEQPDPDEYRYVQKAMGTVSDLAGGSLVQAPMLGELIDLQRNREAFVNAGASEAPLPPNGRVSYPKLTGGSTAYWVGEVSQITESQETTGSLLLEAKKLAILVKINNELLKFANPVAEAMIRNDMSRVGALKADLSMLEGTGGTQIKGLITYSDQNSGANDPLYAYTAGTVAADGNTFKVTDVAGMEGVLPDAVPEATAWLMRRNMYAALMNRRADAASASDAAGPFMFWMTRGDAERGPVRELYGTPVVRSSQISNTRVKGNGTNLTYIILGYFPDWVIARMGVMEFLASNQGDTPFQYDQTWLRGIQYIDAGARHARSFVFCDNLLVA